MPLDVIAEGVETPERERLLIDHHCRRIQGHLFSCPVAATKIPEILEKRFLFVPKVETGGNGDDDRASPTQYGGNEHRNKPSKIRNGAIRENQDRLSKQVGIPVRSADGPFCGEENLQPVPYCAKMKAWFGLSLCPSFAVVQDFRVTFWPHVIQEGEAGRSF